MKTSKLTLLLFGILSFAEGRDASAQAPKNSKIPTFSEYAVAEVFKGKPATPKFTNPAQLSSGRLDNPTDRLPDADDRYRGSVEIDAEKGPNFSGRFTIAKWSCGIACSSMMVIDAPTGQIYRNAPYGTLDIQAGNGRNFAGLSYRLDSSLLVVEGCIDVDKPRAKGNMPECSRSYYNWKPPKFILVQRIPLSIPPGLKEYLSQ